MSSFPLWDLEQIQNEIAQRGGYGPAPANLESVVRGEQSIQMHAATEEEAEFIKCLDVAATVASPGWARIQKNLEDIAKEAERECQKLYDSGADGKLILESLTKAKNFRYMYNRHIREVQAAVDMAKPETYI